MACLLITPGEPAGIGPDVLLALAGKPRRSRWVVLADPELLRARAEQPLPVSLERFDPAGCRRRRGAGGASRTLRAPVVPGCSIRRTRAMWWRPWRRPRISCWRAPPMRW